MYIATTCFDHTIIIRRPDKWILHHDNAPVHDALRACEFLAKKNALQKIDHSPNLALRDFWLFPKLKNALKGLRFAGIPNIQRNVTTLLPGIPENNFQDFPAVAPSSHEVHIFTRRAFRRQKQPLVHG
jgi:hypothetical protein